MNDTQTNPFVAAILAALDAHIDARIAAALASQPKPKPETETVVDMDKLRELVAPIVRDQTNALIEQAIEIHTDAYDHDEYDRVCNMLDDYDLDGFLTENDIEEKVESAVKDLTFTVSVE